MVTFKANLSVIIKVLRSYKQKIVLAALLEGKSMPSNMAANTNYATLLKNQGVINIFLKFGISMSPTHCLKEALVTPPIDGWFRQKFWSDMSCYDVTLRKNKALMALGIYIFSVSLLSEKIFKLMVLGVSIYPAVFCRSKLRWISVLFQCLLAQSKLLCKP